MIHTDAAGIDGETSAQGIRWYRSPVAPQDLKRLLRRRDLPAWIQAGGYLGILAATAAAAAYSFRHWPWWTTVLLVFAHGTVAAFLINAVHELNHATVFTSAHLNRAFANLFALLGWINHDVYLASHVRHHRYTLHPPDDLEVVLPLRFTKRDFFLAGFVNFNGLAATFHDTWRWACGRFEGDWELQLYPPGKPEFRDGPVRWARMLLISHATILLLSLWSGFWILPLLVSVPRYYGGWLFFLCNNTQHTGLQDKVPDFRLCCRSFTLARPVAFLYWHMNFHTEHHMYPGVPCYHLAQLHELIRDDLPACPDGIAAAWSEIRLASPIVTRGA